jgi:cytochrome c556
MPTPTVGQSLSTMIDNLTDLILNLPDGPQRDALIQQHKRLTDQLQALIDNAVPQDTAKYRAATAALEKANTSLVVARQDIARVAETIDAIAKVVGVVGELAASIK